MSSAPEFRPGRCSVYTVLLSAACLLLMIFAHVAAMQLATTDQEGGHQPTTPGTTGNDAVSFRSTRKDPGRIGSARNICGMMQRGWAGSTRLEFSLRHIKYLNIV